MACTPIIKEGRKVHVVGLDGRLLYTRLLDTGGPVLEFAGPHALGFIVRSDVPYYGWQIRPGWPETASVRADLHSTARRWERMN